MPDIDTANRYMVGVKGEKIVVLLPPTAVISKLEALTFAAWLVTMAVMLPDETPTFEEIMDEVLDT
jgi:hypothetical protein